MAMLTIRNLPEELHMALRARAASHRRSMEAEVRAILEATIRPTQGLRLGSLLARIGEGIALTEQEHAALTAREATPVRPLPFE